MCVFMLFGIGYFSITINAKEKKSVSRITVTTKGEGFRRKKRVRTKKFPKNQTQDTQVLKKRDIESEMKLSKAEENKPTKRMSRKKQKISQPKVAKKTLSTMNFEELKKSKCELITAGNKEVAIKYLEKMIPLCIDMYDRSQVMVELGDIYYETGRLAKAFTMYREFVNLYPGSEQVEYSLYRAIICKFDDISDAERDQTPTKETIDLAAEFLERSDVFITYKDKVEDILKKCRERLFENELTVFSFYLFNKRIVAATKRLDLIKKEFVLLMPELEPRIMLLEVELAQAQNNNELVEQKQDELVTKFPDYVVHMAQATPKKKHFAAQF